MNAIRKMRKEIRNVEKNLHNATSNAQTDQGFLGIVYNHFENVSDDLKFVIHDVEQMNTTSNKNLIGNLKMIYNNMEMLEKKIKNKVLTEKQSKEYQQIFSQLHERFNGLIKDLGKQINQRNKLINSIDHYINSLKRHKRVIRRASRRGLQFENRFGKNVKSALKAIEHLLTIEIPSRINMIKNPPGNKVGYGTSPRSSKIEEVKARSTKSQRSVWEVKV